MDGNDMTPTRIHTVSEGSDSEFSEEFSPIPKYDMMTFDEMMVVTENMDTDVFENTRKFSPRKHRSCHRRAEPVSESQRKCESSKNSREYTKRNRDEIKVCQNLHEDIEAKKARIEELIAEMKPDVVVVNTRRCVKVFEEIMQRYTTLGSNIHEVFSVPNPESFFAEYIIQAKIAETLKFETGIESYEQKLQELHEQFAALSLTKEALNSQKDKTNYASSKSRLKQRIVRAQLKTYCWKGWNAIETMRLQGKHLKECSDKLKEQIWNNVLAIYSQLLQVMTKLETMNIHDRKSLELIRDMFAPYSKTAGNLKMNWVPKQEAKENATNIEKKSEIVEVQKPSTPVSVSLTSSPIPSVIMMPRAHLLNSLPQTALAKTAIPKPLSSPSYTLALPTVPVNFLVANTGMTPTVTAVPKLAPKIAPLPTPPKVEVSNILGTVDTQVDTQDEEFVDVETVTEIPRKRSKSPSETVEAKKPKTHEEEKKVTVESAEETTTGRVMGFCPPNRMPQAFYQHTMMMNQHRLPPPLVIQNNLTPDAVQKASAEFQQLMAHSPFYPSPMSPEILSFIQNQQHIRKLLHDKFSKLEK